MHRMGVVDDGLMGSGIAEFAARAGLEVVEAINRPPREGGNGWQTH